MLHLWTKINAEQWLGNGLDGPQFESWLGQEIFFLKNFQTDSGDHSVSYSIGMQVLSWELRWTGHEVDWAWSGLGMKWTGHEVGWAWSGLGMKLTTHLHLVPRLIINGAIPSFLFYAFMAGRGNNFTFNLFKLFMHQNNVDNHMMEAKKL